MLVLPFWEFSCSNSGATHELDYNSFTAKWHHDYNEQEWKYKKRIFIIFISIKHMKEIVSNTPWLWILFLEHKVNRLVLIPKYFPFVSFYISIQFFVFCPWALPRAMGQNKYLTYYSIDTKQFLEVPSLIDYLFFYGNSTTK